VNSGGLCFGRENESESSSCASEVGSHSQRCQSISSGSRQHLETFVQV